MAQRKLTTMASVLRIMRATVVGQGLPPMIVIGDGGGRCQHLCSNSELPVLFLPIRGFFFLKKKREKTCVIV